MQQNEEKSMLENQKCPFSHTKDKNYSSKEDAEHHIDPAEQTPYNEHAASLTLLS